MAGQIQRRWIMLAYGASVLLCGCGDGLPETIPVSGTITFDGAAPPEPGTITFLPIDLAAGEATRPGWAQFEKDGQYKAKAFSKAEGLVPGKYEVRIECWKTRPNESTGSPGESYVPDDFHEELIVRIDSTDPIVASFDIATTTK